MTTWYPRELRTWKEQKHKLITGTVTAAMPLPQGKDAGIQGSNLQRHQPNKAEGYFGFVMWQAQDFETAIVRGFTPLVS